ncbi:MAG: Wzz/FepE/Etk N-terminal domain-containing protein [bacterium]|nr:Wzz/FepE/Etk N-terminal domain-containing protein [bacterium]
MNDEIRIEDVRISLLELWKKKWLIISVTVLAGLVGLLFTMNKSVTNTYVATASVYSTSNSSNENGISGNTAILSYTDIATSKKICESAASLLSTKYSIDADTIQSMVSVTQASDTIVNISAVSKDSETAIEVANAMSDAFVREVTTITGLDSIQILDTASIAYLKSDGKKALLETRLLFAAFGFAASAGIIFIKELFSNRVRTIVQCIDESEEEIIGILPKIEERTR